MHPDFVNLPNPFGTEPIAIKMYGFWLMVGFLSASWLAMKRATRIGVDADKVLDLCFVSLIFGVAGARLMYVAHYWQEQFADSPNKLLAIVDIRQGGLEFLGGLLAAALGVVGYLKWKGQSLRLFLDILAPSTMWGLAFGRVGCFLNGCCYGALCAVGAADQPQYPWAVRFPYESPAQIQQWWDREITIPAELIVTDRGALEPWLVDRAAIDMPPEDRDQTRRLYQELKRRLDETKASDADAATIQRIQEELDAASARLTAVSKKLRFLHEAQKYPSRNEPTRRTLVSELEDLAHRCESRPVHPAQLYATINGLLLYALLSAVFYRRKRHGVVIGLLFVLYPVARFFEEMLRADNPHDTFGLTVSQFLSVAMFVGGMVYLILLYTKLPERSPLADAAGPNPEQEP